MRSAGVARASENLGTPGTGFLFALGAFGIWGLAPLFWSLLTHLNSFELLAHRILWSFVLSLGLLAWMEPGLPTLRRLRDPRILGTMLVSTTLIAVNWFVFIWAVTHGRVTETSIGYYTNPILNVLLGRVVLGERLNERQVGAVFLAAIGVGYLTWSFGSFPWVSLALAFSFGTYGLVRKTASMPPIAGLTIETGLCAPLCIGYILLGTEGRLGVLETGSVSDVVLVLAGGPITATPLLLFAAATRRLQYSTIGMIQYLAPSLQLMCAVLFFGEPFTRTHLVTFIFIWSAVALYAFDSAGRAMRSRR